MNGNELFDIVRDGELYAEAKTALAKADTSWRHAVIQQNSSRFRNSSKTEPHLQDSSSQKRFLNP